MSSDVVATAATLAAAITNNPAVAAAWLNYAAAQAARDAGQDKRITDVERSLAAFRGDQDRAIDAAVRGALEANSIRVDGFAALVDSVVVQEKLIEALTRRMDDAAEERGEILRLLRSIAPLPPRPIPQEAPHGGS